MISTRQVVENGVDAGGRVLSVGKCGDLWSVCEKEMRVPENL